MNQRTRLLLMAMAAMGFLWGGDYGWWEVCVDGLCELKGGGNQSERAL